MTDQLTEELQIAMDALEAQMDPSDTEIQAYARACNRVQGDEDAINARYKAEREKLDANRDKMLKGCENARKSISWKWDRMIKDLIYQKIKGTKKRYVDTLFGRLGWRKTPAKVKRMYRADFNKDTALEWAKVECPDAVSSKESVAIKDLPANCPQIWIEDVPSEDKFYFKAPKPKQEKE
jgi:hypothetical protein